MEPRTAEHFRAHRGAQKAEQKGTGEDKEDKPQERVIREELAHPDHDARVDWDRLPYFGEHVGEARDNERHHEDNDDEESADDERRIDERILCLCGDFVVAVEVVGEEREGLVKLSRFLAGSHHVDVKI